MITTVDDALAWYTKNSEKWIPWILAVASAIATYWQGENAIAALLERGWAFEKIYSAVFGVASVLSGFLLTFYAVIVTLKTRFVEAIKDSPAFFAYRSYVKQALVLGFVLTIFTVPFIMAEPYPESQPSLIAISLWIGACVLVFASFFRVVRNFFMLLEHESKPRRGAG